MFLIENLIRFKERQLLYNLVWMSIILTISYPRFRGVIQCWAKRNQNQTKSLIEHHYMFVFLFIGLSTYSGMILWITPFNKCWVSVFFLGLTMWVVKFINKSIWKVEGLLIKNKIIHPNLLVRTITYMAEFIRVWLQPVILPFRFFINNRFYLLLGGVIYLRSYTKFFGFIALSVFWEIPILLVQVFLFTILLFIY